jgi:hypothetical protein
MSAPDLTAAEQTNVRTALRFLRSRCGTWAAVSKALRFGESTVPAVATGTRSVTPVMAFRVARFAKVSVDDVLSGRFPAPGTCPHCGHRPDGAP